MILQLGWRNLWRRPRRSLITISTVGSAFAFLIALIGLAEGLSLQLLKNGTALLLGHLQIHHRDYLPDRNLYDTIDLNSGIEPGALLAALKASPEVQAVSARVYGFGLASTGEQSAGIQMVGLDPQTEQPMSRLREGLVEGAWLGPPGQHTIILGETLAQELKADLGSIVAVVTQAADGSIGNDLFRVSGILRTGLSYLDRSLALFHLADLQILLALGPGEIHEIAITIDEAMDADRFAALLNRSGNLPRTAIARSWGELSPQLKDYVGLAQGMNRFIIILVALFAAFGVLNTMMMAVYERTREIGLVEALGMAPMRILLSVILESLFLTLLGLAGGLAIGAPLMIYLTTHGWDLSRWMGTLSMVGTHMDPVLKAVWSWDQILWSAIGLTLAALLAAYLPAHRAARMDPVKALQAPAEGA